MSVRSGRTRAGQDPLDGELWNLPPLAHELSELSHEDSGRGGLAADRIVAWVCDTLDAGSTPSEVCEAAMWFGLRHSRTEGRGPHGFVTHSVLAANSCAAIGRPHSRHTDGDSTDGDRVVAAVAAAQLVAYAVGTQRGGANDEREGPSRLGWYEPSSLPGDPIDNFLAAALDGECELTDHCWLAAAEHDPGAAEQALISAGAAGYHLNEHKLIYPAQLRRWTGTDAALDPVLFRAAARYVGNHLQDPPQAISRRADAGTLAEMMADEPNGSTAGDLQRISTVATGVARTPAREIVPLLLGSLQDGLAPADLIDAISLVTAARFAETSFGTDPVGPVHACTGANALRLCLERSDSLDLSYELALCATESPSLSQLAQVEELSVPPFDDGALEDLLAALDDGDPDAASEAASAVPPGDSDSVDAAWAAVRDAAVTDEHLVLHGIKHCVAMEDDFRTSEHPARIWFLAAAARTAAHATSGPNQISDGMRRRLA